MVPAFTRKLLQWHRHANTRQMPWKGEKDPYRIWLSEIILQQTRVEQGRAYYEKFISRFPDIKSLARASDDQVFKLWEGLGYYTRCRNLIATARYIAGEQNAEFPNNYDDIRRLKGIGPYTAAAIASFAFNQPCAVVDGNVQRVLARYFGITTPVDSGNGKKLFNQLAQALISHDTPAEYNQAIMDFGAVVCKPRAPLCSTCIQRNDCMAFRTGTVEELPVKAKSAERKNRWLYYFLIHYNGRYYVRQRTQKDIWQNLYEFVLYESDVPLSGSRQLTSRIKALLQGVAYRKTGESEIRRQALSHQNLQGRFIHLQVNEPVPSLSEYQLVTEKKLKQLAFPRFITQYLDEMN